MVFGAARTRVQPAMSEIGENQIIAQMYEMIMEKAMIEVRAFQKRAAAAEWLGVPIKVLEPPS